MQLVQTYCLPSLTVFKGMGGEGYGLTYKEPLLQVKHVTQCEHEICSAILKATLKLDLYQTTLSSMCLDKQ